MHKTAYTLRDDSFKIFQYKTLVYVPNCHEQPTKYNNYKTA